MAFRLIYTLRIALSLTSMFFALAPMRNRIRQHQASSRGNVEMKTNKEPFRKLQPQNGHSSSSSTAEAERALKGYDAFYCGRRPTFQKESPKIQIKKDTGKPKSYGVEATSGTKSYWQFVEPKIQKDDENWKPKSAPRLPIQTVSGTKSFSQFNEPEIQKNDDNWKPKSAPRLRIQTVSGYIDSLAKYNGNPNKVKIRNFVEVNALHDTDDYRNSINIENYMKEFFKNFWSDWFTAKRIFDWPKPVINHIVNVFAWTCLEIRQMVKSKRTEDFAHLQARIQSVFDGLHRYAKQLVIVDCPLEFPENIIVPAKIAKKHLVYKNSYVENNDKYEGETLVLLLHGKPIQSYLSHQPKDVINIVRDKNPRFPSVRKLTDKEVSSSSPDKNEIIKPIADGFSRSATKYRANSAIIINFQTYGYLTSMKLFEANKREDISIWEIPGAFKYSFTLPENAKYLEKYQSERREKRDWTIWRELYDESDTVREHCIKSYAQACVEIQNMVGSDYDADLLQTYERIFARDSNQRDYHRAEFHCFFKFKYTGRIISTKIVKMSRAGNYDGPGTHKTMFPNEEFMVFLDDRLMDVVLLEEGKKNMKVLRYFWEHNRVKDPHQAKNKSVEKTESDVEAFYDNMKSGPSNSKKYEMPPDDGSDVWSFYYKKRGG